MRITAIQQLNASLQCFLFSFPVIYFCVYSRNLRNGSRKSYHFQRSLAFVNAAETPGQLPCQTDLWIENPKEATLLICKLTAFWSFIVSLMLHVAGGAYNQSTSVTRMLFHLYNCISCGGQKNPPLTGSFLFCNYLH